jgi:hypothetical protein
MSFIRLSEPGKPGTMPALPRFFLTLPRVAGGTTVQSRTEFANTDTPVDSRFLSSYWIYNHLA